MILVSARLLKWPQGKICLKTFELEKLSAEFSFHFYCTYLLDGACALMLCV